jgi:hypothetical protein
VRSIGSLTWEEMRTGSWDGWASGRGEIFPRVTGTYAVAISSQTARPASRACAFGFAALYHTVKFSGMIEARAYSKENNDDSRL